MGALPSRDGIEWRALKLRLNDDVHHGEIILNVGIDADQGERVEKDATGRDDWIHVLRSALGDVCGLASTSGLSKRSKVAPHAPAARSQSPFKVGDAVRHQMGPGRVTALRVLEVEGQGTQVMVEVVLKSGIRLMAPAAAATTELDRIQ